MTNGWIVLVLLRSPGSGGWILLFAEWPYVSQSPPMVFVKMAAAGPAKQMIVANRNGIVPLSAKGPTTVEGVSNLEKYRDCKKEC